MNRHRKREVEEERTTSVNTVRTGLDDRDVLTNKNAYLLEAGLRDTPIYYAGLEKLIYNAETNALDIVIFGENIKVDYEEHRTDLYLQPNRGVKKIIGQKLLKKCRSKWLRRLKNVLTLLQKQKLQ